MGITYHKETPFCPTKITRFSCNCNLKITYFRKLKREATTLVICFIFNPLTLSQKDKLCWSYFEKLSFGPLSINCKTFQKLKFSIFRFFAFFALEIVLNLGPVSQSYPVSFSPSLGFKIALWRLCESFSRSADKGKRNPSICRLKPNLFQCLAN